MGKEYLSSFPFGTIFVTIPAFLGLIPIGWILGKPKRSTKWIGALLLPSLLLLSWIGAAYDHQFDLLSFKKFTAATNHTLQKGYHLDEMITDLKDGNGWYRTSCSACTTEYVNLFLHGLELHRNKKWMESNECLEKAFAINSDHAMSLCLYIFLNYSMLHDSEKQQEWWDNTVAYDFPTFDGVTNNPIYGGLFREKKMIFYVQSVNDYEKTSLNSK